MTKIEFFEMIVQLSRENGYVPSEICAFTGKLFKTPRWSIVDELNTWREIEVITHNDLTSQENYATISL